MSDIDLTEAIEAGCKAEYLRRVREIIAAQNLPRGKTVSYLPWEDAGAAAQEEIRRGVEPIVRAGHRSIASQGWVHGARHGWAQSHAAGYNAELYPDDAPIQDDPYKED